MQSSNWKRTARKGGSTKKLLLAEGANKALGAAMTPMPYRGVQLSLLFRWRGKEAAPKGQNATA